VWLPLIPKALLGNKKRMIRIFQNRIRISHQPTILCKINPVNIPIIPIKEGKKYFFLSSVFTIRIDSLEKIRAGIVAI